MLDQYVLLIVNFACVAILARLLSPQETGLFAVATSIAFVVIEIRTFGVGEYLIREKETSAQTIRSVLGVMIIMSWGLAIVLILAAPWAAKFYNAADLRNLLWIIVIPFFLAPYCSIPTALLAREMNFAAILKINLAGTLVRNGVSIGLVLADFSYYGLAYGAFAGVVAEFLAATYYRPKNMPWVPDFKNISAIFSSGGMITFSKFLTSSSQNMSDLVLGRITSMNDVGLFSRGLGLIMFLNNALVKATSPVALPHLSQIRRSGGSVVDEYLRAVALVGAFTIPLFAVVNIAAYPMIFALFGNQWGESADLATILAFWAILQSLHCFAAHALMATGQEKLVLIRSLVLFFSRLILIAAAAVYSLKYVAYGFVLSGLIDFLLTTAIMRSALNLSTRRFLMAHLPNFIVAASCWSTLKLMTQFIQFESMNPWLALLIMGLSMLAVWLIALKLSRNSASFLIDEVVAWLVRKLSRATQ